MRQASFMKTWFSKVSVGMNWKADCAPWLLTWYQWPTSCCWMGEISHSNVPKSSGKYSQKSRGCCSRKRDKFGMGCSVSTYSHGKTWENYMPHSHASYPYTLPVISVLLCCLFFAYAWFSSLSQEPPEDEANIIEKILSVRTIKKEVVWPLVVLF